MVVSNTITSNPGQTVISNVSAAAIHKAFMPYVVCCRCQRATTGLKYRAGIRLPRRYEQIMLFCCLSRTALLRQPRFSTEAQKMRLRERTSDKSALTYSEEAAAYIYIYNGSAACRRRQHVEAWRYAGGERQRRYSVYAGTTSYKAGTRRRRRITGWRAPPYRRLAFRARCSVADMPLQRWKWRRCAQQASRIYIKTRR